MATAGATRVASMALEQKRDNSETTKGVRHLEHNCQDIEEKEQPLSLQEAFLQFRKKKQVRQTDCEVFCTYFDISSGLVLG